MPGYDILPVSGRRTGITVGYDCAVTSLDWPALMPWDAESLPAAASGAPREAMVVFRDGTWRLCRVTGWWQEPPPERHWWYLLRWGVQGIVREGWFRHDPAVVTPCPLQGAVGGAARASR